MKDKKLRNAMAEIGLTYENTVVATYDGKMLLARVRTLEDKFILLLNHLNIGVAHLDAKPKRFEFFDIPPPKEVSDE